MKKFLSSIFTLFVLLNILTVSVADAYLPNRPVILSVEFEEAIYQIGDTVTGSFYVKNFTQEKFYNIQYRISVGEINESQTGLYDQVGETGMLGPIDISPNGTQKFDFEYIITDKVNGELGLMVWLYTDTGFPESRAVQGIVVEGEATNLIESLLYVDGFLTESGTGPIVSDNSVAYLLIYTEQDIQNSPATLKLYDRVVGDNSSILATDITFLRAQDVFASDDIIFSEYPDMAANIYVLELPKDLEPMVVAGVVEFDKSLKISDANFRYIIDGPQTTVLSLELAPQTYVDTKDLEFILELSGSHFDFLNPENDTAVDQVVVVLEILDEDGNIVYTQEPQQYSITPEEASNKFSLIATNVDIKSYFKARITIYDVQQENILSTYEKEFNLPSSPVDKSSVNILIYVLLALSIIPAILIVYFYRKNKNKIIITSASLMLVMIGGIGYIYLMNQSVNAAGSADLYIISFTGTHHGSAGLNIYSPQSPYVRAYQPGQVVSFDTTALFYTCTNDGGAGVTATAFPDNNDWHSIRGTDMNDLSALKESVLRYDGTVDLFSSSIYGGRDRRWVQTGRRSTTLQVPTNPGIYLIPIRFDWGHRSGRAPNLLTRLNADPTLSFQDDIRALAGLGGRRWGTIFYGIPICVEGGGFCPTEKETGILSCTKDETRTYKVGDTVTFTANIENPINPQDTRFWWPNTSANSKGTTVNTYTPAKYTTPGVKTFTILGQSQATNYGPATCTVTIEPPAEVTCSVSSQTAVVDETSIRYTATLLAGVRASSYQWYIGSAVSGAQLIQGATQSIYQKTYNTLRENTSRIIEVTKTDGAKVYGICPAVTINCGPKPTSGETACSEGSKKQYFCTDNGWELRDRTCNLDGGGDGDGGDGDGGGGGNNGTATANRFEFSPRIANQNGMCSLFLDIDNVRECKLNSRVGLVNTFVANANNQIITNLDKTIGQYTLTCIQEDGVTEVTLGTQSCSTNASVEEI